MEESTSTPSPEELASRLFVVASAPHYSVQELTTIAIHTYAQLRAALTIFLGPAGFDALWGRALYLVQGADFWNEVLLVPHPHPLPHYLDRVTQGCDAPEAHKRLLELFTQFLTTLFTFIGADLGYRLLQHYGPGVSPPLPLDHSPEAPS